MPSVIIKSADQARTSTTAAADDSELIIALAAQTLYEIEGTIRYGTSSSTPSFKYGWKFTGSLIFANGVILANNRQHPQGWRDADNIGAHYNITAGLLTNGSTISNVGTTGNFSTSCLRCYLKVGDTGGNFSLQWAQVNSSASATTVFAGSCLYVAERVVPS
jgi:hypothetical protein